VKQHQEYNKKIILLILIRINKISKQFNIL